jgi:hypothetical protein
LFHRAAGAATSLTMGLIAKNDSSYDKPSVDPQVDSAGQVYQLRSGSLTLA